MVAKGDPSGAENQKKNTPRLYSQRWSLRQIFTPIHVWNIVPYGVNRPSKKVLTDGGATRDTLGTDRVILLITCTPERPFRRDATEIPNVDETVKT